MRLIKGEKLNKAQIDEIKRAFVHRYTGEHKPEWANSKRPDGTDYEPTHATDLEWIREHAFYIRADGTLSRSPNYCEPAYIADDPEYAKVRRLD